MENIGKKLVEKYCKHQGYGNYSVYEKKLIKAINDALKKARQEGAIATRNDVAKEIREPYVIEMEEKLEGLCKWVRAIKGITQIDIMELVEYLPEYEEYLRRAKESMGKHRS